MTAGISRIADAAPDRVVRRSGRNARARPEYIARRTGRRSAVDLGHHTRVVVVVDETYPIVLPFWQNYASSASESLTVRLGKAGFGDDDG